MISNSLSEIEQLFEKHKDTILKGINSGLGLRKICFGYDPQLNPDGDPHKEVKRDGGIQEFIEFAKTTNSAHLTVGLTLARLLLKRKG